jgi:hypothetical protein
VNDAVRAANPAAAGNEALVMPGVAVAISLALTLFGTECRSEGGNAFRRAVLPAALIE